MATDGLDSRLGSEMGLTCKHEFQSWTCVMIMKIRPPLVLKRDNDMHMPPTNPTSQKVNSVEENSLANPLAMFSPNFS